MKYKITGLMIGVAMMIPFVASAQALPTDTTLQDELTAALQQVIGLLQQEVQLLTTQLAEKLQQVSDNQTAISNNQQTITNQLSNLQQNSIPTDPPVVGGIPQVQIPLDCTATTESNTGAPSSFINLSWTSTGATVASVTNNHVGSQLLPPFDIQNIASGTQKYQLSSEPGENNIITIHFAGNGQTKDCGVEVLTQ